MASTTVAAPVATSNLTKWVHFGLTMLSAVLGVLLASKGVVDNNTVLEVLGGAMTVLTKLGYGVTTAIASSGS